MTNNSLLLLIIISILSCSKNDEGDKIPLIEGEVITEITHLNSEGVVTRRFELTHDGSRFTSYYRYDLNSEGEWEFVQNADFSYDSQNRLTEVVIFYNEDRTSGPSSKFGYDWGTNSYFFNRYQLNQDNEFYIDSFEEHPYNLPENGYKELNGFIWGFQNGNNVGSGAENPNGDLEEFGKMWSYNENLLYDNLPNFRSDQAIDFTLGQRNLFSSLNANNWVAYRFPQGNLETYTHEIVDGKIRSTSYENGSKIEFSYAVEQE